MIRELSMAFYVSSIVNSTKDMDKTPISLSAYLGATDRRTVTSWCERMNIELTKIKVVNREEYFITLIEYDKIIEYIQYRLSEKYHEATKYSLSNMKSLRNRHIEFYKNTRKRIKENDR